MFLKSLNLTNFRNYSSLDLTFDHRPTIFLGSNGAGKSNILEAIYLLATTKSPRAESEEELIKTGTGHASVWGEIKEGEDQTDLQITLAAGVEGERFFKKTSVNGVGRRIVDFIGNLPAVIFWPSDINMVIGSPSLRRWHLDISLAQILSPYKKSLTLYEQFLTARNKVLKRIREGQGRVDELEFWTKELIKYGQMITEARKEFFNFLNHLENPLGDFKFEYKQSELSEEKLKTTNGREVAAAATLIGPHRDDFMISLGDRNMAKFGSRGEQRMATLAFKMAILEYMSFSLAKRPILLLDDVFSELDSAHRATVASIAKMQQTIIATVELENIPQDFLDSSRILKVEDGEII